MGAVKEKKSFINKNLIILKIVIFFTFVGIACIHIYNSILPFYLGLKFDEYRLISIITPLISMIGPLIIGPLTDNIAAKNPNKFGRFLRILLAACLILSTIFYVILFFIPPVKRLESRRPLVSFGCDGNGGMIYQERCIEHKCHNWNHKYGDLILTNCSYTCQNPEKFERLYLPWLNKSQQSALQQAKLQQAKLQQQQYVPTVQDSDYSDEELHTSTTQLTPLYSSGKRKRSINPIDNVEQNDSGGLEELSIEDQRKKIKRNIDQVYVQPPHLCEKVIKENGSIETTKCHVYTEHSKRVKVKVTLKGAENIEDSSLDSKWCFYPLESGFGCEIPQPQIDYMISHYSQDCKPKVECEIIDPYDSKTSVLYDGTCMAITGDAGLTVVTYYILRPIAAIFLLAALALLNTAIVIAVRETSTGRGEISRQYAWGALGWIFIIPVLVLYKNDINEIHTENYIMGSSIEIYLVTLLVTAVLSFGFVVLILLLPTQMPLSPPEWWWHTKTGMLVYPMSAIRKYCPEIVALCLITILLGIFWGSIHSYVPWVLKDIYGVSYIGVILLLLLFFNVDKFIEYCSHSNILIGIFALYIIRFTGLHINNEDTTLTIIMEIFEPLYITIELITVMMYMRHILPRKYTATGQAIIIALHFCFGKFFGALIGLALDEKRPQKYECIYEILAYIALIISAIYFILYNFILAPCFRAKAQPAPQLTLNNLSQQQQQQQQPRSQLQPNNGLQTNGANGNYTPLRVYHNERGKKGQFRY